MGHLRLGALPRTREWREVVGFLEEGATTSAVAEATGRAARLALAEAKADPGLIEAFFLLTQIPLAARSELGLGPALRAQLDVGDDPTLFDIGASLADAVERRLAESRRRTDIGEMAQLAAVETLNDVVGRRLPSLFELTTSDLRATLASFATEKQFGALARVFFARFTERILTYYLSRELAAHVGPGRRFRDVGDRSAFDEAIRRHCFEAARIVEDYAGQWTSKKTWLGELDRVATRQFARVAFKKLARELSAREVARGR